ncbi:MAG: hypothetical protein K6F71_02125 [Ruminococcus sp.]|uniref:hypothetical protein n=1 Tax=Ruminococcus sp. TaxID=41978 RepID=UPI0025F92EAD|nr:hypothetical protein [Ruminococcus sp.]MCR5539622.1 hypothetical protein [Ruminococcus sp.]
MEHSRIKKLAAAVACTALLLTGCGKAEAPDISKDYKEYLDYAFDGNYSISKPTEQRFDIEDRTEYTWQVIYTGNDGSDRSTSIWINRGDDEGKKYIAYDTDYTVADMVARAQGTEVYEEIADQILSKYFKETAKTDGALSINSDGFTLSAHTTNCKLSSADLLAEFIKPGSGEKYVGTNLADWACDKYNYIDMSICIIDDTKTEELTEKFNDICNDYIALTKDPQTYRFELKKQDSEKGWVTVASECKVMGKDYDAKKFQLKYVAEELGIDIYADLDLD